MTQRVYLDHNVVVALLNRQLPEAADFRASLKEGKFRAVLSPTHWVEAARSNSRFLALATAEVMDSLGALWVRERRDLQRREIQAWANGKPGDRRVIDPFGLTASEVATELSGMQGAAAIMTSITIVGYLQANPGFGATMQTAYRANAEGFERNVQHVREGELTAEKEQEIWVTWLCGVASEAKICSSPDQLGSAQRKFFPSIITEFEVAKENWKRGVENPDMKLSPQRLGDAFHVIVALPYVNYVVSGDSRLRALIQCVGPKLPFGTAEPIESLVQLVGKI